MSLEIFCIRYPPTEELNKIIQEEASSFRRSKIVTLARNLAREGGRGLREASSKFNGSDTMFALDEESILRIPTEFRVDVVDYLTAVVVGNSIISIDEMIWDKKFSLRNWYDRYNFDTSGTLFIPIRLGGGKDESRVIDDSMWRKVISLAIEDKTLASFFTDKNKHLIPVEIEKYIEDTDMRLTINGTILPLYSPRAKFLISES